MENLNQLVRTSMINLAIRMLKSRKLSRNDYVPTTQLTSAIQKRPKGLLTK